MSESGAKKLSDSVLYLKFSCPRLFKVNAALLAIALTIVLAAVLNIVSVIVMTIV